MPFVRFISVFLTLLLGYSAFAGSRTNDRDVSLREKIGQMLLVGISPLRAGDIFNEISRYQPGGILLHKNDIESPAKLRELIKKLKSRSRLPLFIAIDEEGGSVSRLKAERGFIEKTSPAEISEQGAAAVKHWSALIAADLKAAGINLNFAPVVDTASNPNNKVIVGLKRSFSESPQRVTEHAGLFIDIHHQHGILTSLKHFPGHGNTNGDSHGGFTDMSTTWNEQELLPFQNLIRGNKADTIMAGHLFNSRLDPKLPASLSVRVLQGILRQRLGFNGVIISDDLQMGAITHSYKLREAVKLAINAGNDILIFGQMMGYTPLKQLQDTIESLVRSNEIPVSRIEESYKRIMALKKGLK